MRYPVAAGSFYPNSMAALESSLENLAKKNRRSFRHGLCPHAGYSFSGPCAAETFSRLKRPETFLILGPNHYGMGEDIAIDGRPWMTPLGIVDIDTALASSIDLPIDPLAHEKEHSIEVQLPFIQKIFPGSKFLPVSIKSCDPKETAKKISKGIKGSGKNVSVIASSDLTHYGPAYNFAPFPPEKAVKIDKEMLDQIARLDVRSFIETSGKTSVCGVYPILVLMHLMKSKGKVVCYMNSGQDKSNFVGYGGVVFG